MLLTPSELPLAKPLEIKRIGFAVSAKQPRLLGATFGAPNTALFDLLRADGSFLPEGQRADLSTALKQRMGAAQWHVCSRSDGSHAVIMTDPLSASCGLLFDSSHDETEVHVSAKYERGVFVGPRWIKGACDQDATIFAIDAQPYVRRIVRFSERTDHGHWHEEFDVVHAPENGRIESIEIVSHRSSYVLLYKSFLPRVEAEDLDDSQLYRTDSTNGDWLAGSIFALELDAKLEVVGGPDRPLGDLLAFDFDADISGDDVFILATTKEGLFLWSWRPSERGAAPTLVGQFKSDLPLTQPRVAVSYDMIHYAVIASARTDDMRILVGSVPAI